MSIRRTNVSETRPVESQTRDPDFESEQRAPYTPPNVVVLSLNDATDFKPSPVPGEIGTTTGS